MNVFLNRLLWFFFTLTILLVLLNTLHSYYNSGPIHWALQYKEVVQKNVNANGIIIGTSHATHSIRPSILDKTGIKFYNFALNGAGPSFYLKWYIDFFSITYNKPQYCIFAVDWFMFNESWLYRDIEGDIEHMPFRLFLTYLGRPNEFNIKKLILNRPPVLKYRKDLLKYLKLSTRDYGFYFKEEYDRGFIPLHYPFSILNFRQKNTKSPISYSRKRDFEALVKQMRTDKIKLIFIATPEYGINVREYELSESLIYINTLSKKYKIPFINFNTTHRSQINEGITNFSDWGHMNKKGSITFSILLEKELEKYYKNNSTESGFQ